MFFLTFTYEFDIITEITRIDVFYFRFLPERMLHTDISNIEYSQLLSFVNANVSDF